MTDGDGQETTKRFMQDQNMLQSSDNINTTGSRKLKEQHRQSKHSDGLGQKHFTYIYD